MRRNSHPRPVPGRRHPVAGGANAWHSDRNRGKILPHFHCRPLSGNSSRARVENAIRLISRNDIIVVDGRTGIVVINPSESELRFYADRQDEIEAYLKQISRHAHLPAQTCDGHRVSAEANIEALEEIVAAKDNGAEAIGLYRTEFFFMNRVELPDEESLYRDYHDLAELMAPSQVTIRTLDLGADKLTSWCPYAGRRPIPPWDYVPSRGLPAL